MRLHYFYKKECFNIHEETKKIRDEMNELHVLSLLCMVH